jgi:hypothetical protein
VELLEIHAFWLLILRGLNYLGDCGIDERKVLKWILKR